MNKALPGRRAARRGKNSGDGDFRIEFQADAGLTFGAGKTRTLVFGSATLKGVTATVAAVPSDPEANTRMVTALTSVGVELDLPPGTPIFVADPENPDLVIRILQEKRESGFFENGVFKTAK